MNSVAWRSLRSHPLQLVLAALSIALGVAFTMGALSLQDSTKNSYEGVVNATLTADVYIQPNGYDPIDRFSPSPQQSLILASIATDIGPKPGEQPPVTDFIQAIAAVYSGPVVLADKQGHPIITDLAPSIGIGYDPGMTEGGSLTEGVWPTSELQVVLEESTAQRANLSVGDDATLIAGGRILKVSVTGIAKYDKPLSGAVLVIMDRVQAVKAFSQSGMVTSIAVKKADGVTAQAALETVKSRLSADSNAQAVLGSTLRAEALKATSPSAGILSIIVLVLAIAGLIVGGLLAANTLFSLVRADKDQYRVMRTLGTSPTQIVGATLIQALIAGVAGSVIGVAAGLGVARLLAWALPLFAVEVPGTVSVTPLSALWSFLIGLALSLVAGLIPGIRAGRTPLTLRSTEVTLGRVGIARVIIGVVVLVAGLGLVGAALTGYHHILTLCLGAGAVLIGIVLIASFLVLPGVFLMGAPFSAFMSARLATNNVRRAPRRAANAAGILIVGFAVVAGAGTLAASAVGSMSTIAGSEAKTEFVIEPVEGTSTIPQKPIDDMRQMQNVTVFAFGESSVAVTLPDKTSLGRMTVSYGPAGTFTDAINATLVSGEAADFPSGATVSKAFATKYNLKVGDELHLTLSINTPFQTEADIAISLIVETQMLTDITLPDTWLGGQLNIKMKAQAMLPTLVLVNVNDPSAAGELRTKLDEVVDPYLTLKILNRDQYVSQAQNQVAQALGALAALFVFVLLVAMLGIASALTTSMSERTREIGVLKALGLHENQVFGITLIEAVLISLFGAIIGVVAGTALGVVAQRVLAADGVTHLSVPWLPLIGMIVVAAVVGIVAALGAAARSSRLPVLPAEAHD